MAEKQATNIREVLEKAGYTIFRISNTWAKIQKKLNPRANEPEVTNVGDIFGIDDKDVAVNYQESNEEQISAALDLREFLEKQKRQYREHPSRTLTVYNLANYTPSPRLMHCGRAIALQLRCRADLVERLMQESKYLKRD